MQNKKLGPMRSYGQLFRTGEILKRTKIKHVFLYVVLTAVLLHMFCGASCAGPHATFRKVSFVKTNWDEIQSCTATHHSTTSTKCATECSGNHFDSGTMTSYLHATWDAADTGRTCRKTTGTLTRTVYPDNPPSCDECSCTFDGGEPESCGAYYLVPNQQEYLLSAGKRTTSTTQDLPPSLCANVPVKSDSECTRSYSSSLSVRIQPSRSDSPSVPPEMPKGQLAVSGLLTIESETLPDPSTFKINGESPSWVQIWGEVIPIVGGYSGEWRATWTIPFNDPSEGIIELVPV